MNWLKTAAIVVCMSVSVLAALAETALGQDASVLPQAEQVKAVVPLRVLDNHMNIRIHGFGRLNKDGCCQFGE